MAKQITGVVVQNKMMNTVVVKVERKLQHPVYKKYVKKTAKFMADTVGAKYEVGDTVVIEETRPISKNKFFKVVKKTGEAKA